WPAAGGLGIPAGLVDEREWAGWGNWSLHGAVPAKEREPCPKVQKLSSLPKIFLPFHPLPIKSRSKLPLDTYFYPLLSLLPSGTNPHSFSPCLHPSSFATVTMSSDGKV